MSISAKALMEGGDLQLNPGNNIVQLSVNTPSPGQGRETTLQLDTIIVVNHGGECLALEVFHHH
ncbi:hypothetical protein H6G45_09510 [Synechocystis sp. FACHB-383]|uniref:hypothetical protein n=1 Tax=Synechocystis sp. FACHB-383 TaxID=2692864 RepID=UPI001687AFC7|nr:hypothetical protein [Synechocystis sp. FACHB-383]MBD2653721.1 hypothetical protein [Synechocystis sp. FACHB-383]